MTGLAFALLAVGIGFIRAFLYFLRSGDLPAMVPGDAILLAYYLCGFIVAGIVVGVSGAMLPGREATYGRFAVGGMIVMLAIVLGDSDGLTPMDSADWAMVVILGGFFGLAAAWGWVRGDKEGQAREAGSGGANAQPSDDFS